jgi:predicted DsbA family dithiol-disulfide isomerase
MEPSDVKRQLISDEKQQTGPGVVDITYYTDPLCCWSWAMEPQWRQIRQEFGASLNVTYKMGGLLPSWNSFKDSLNSICKPIHMGPEWLHAKYLSGAAIDDRIWIVDPPASSFPACIAVKCAELQSKAIGEFYLGRLREAVLAKGKNIAKIDVLFEIAGNLNEYDPRFDMALFRKHLSDDTGLNAFRSDWQESKYLGINRFPTLILRTRQHAPVILKGYQSYASLSDTLFDLQDPSHPFRT